MDIKRTTNINSTVEAVTSKVNEDIPRVASEINKGVGGIKDAFETAKSVPAEFIASPSVTKKHLVFSEQLVKNAAHEILKAAEAEKISATANQTAAGVGVAAATVATIPNVGPIIAAALSQIAAAIIILGEVQAKGLEDQAAAKEREAGVKPLEKERFDRADYPKRFPD